MVHFTSHTFHVLNSPLTFPPHLPLLVSPSISSATKHSLAQVRSLGVHLSFLLSKTIPSQQVVFILAPQYLSNLFIFHPTTKSQPPLTSRGDAALVQCLLVATGLGMYPSLSSKATPHALLCAVGAASCTYYL